MSKYSNSDYQRAVGEMVSREVIYCVSGLIWHMANGPEHNEEAMELCQSAPDYESAAQNLNWKKIESITDGFIGFQQASGDIVKYCDWEDLCNGENIEPYYSEIYEHWIVTDWLAARLEEKGETVNRDFYGMTIWGRTCSGQAIKLDRVICDIYDETQVESVAA